MKASKVYGVFAWTDGADSHHDGGYVVREGAQAGSLALFPSPYHDQVPVKVYRRQYDASRYADKLNDEQSWHDETGEWLELNVSPTGSVHSWWHRFATDTPTTHPHRTEGTAS